jgi:hypothetical protein
MLYRCTQSSPLKVKKVLFRMWDEKAENQLAFFGKR